MELKLHKLYNPREIINLLVYLFCFLILLSSIAGFAYYAEEPISLSNTPDNLNSISISSTTIKLSWADNSSNESGYKIERAENNPTNFIYLDSTQANSCEYLDQDLSPTIQYFYRIKSYNFIGESNYSPITTPPKFQNKDYLLGIGEFEFSTVTETDYQFEDSVDNNQVSNGWQKVLGGTSADNSIFSLKDGLGLSGSKAQYMAIKNSQSGYKSIQIKRKIYHNPIAFPVGSTIDLQIEKLSFSGYEDLPSGSTVSYSINLSGYQVGGVQLFNQSLNLSPADIKVSSLSAVVPDNLLYIQVVISVMINGNIGSNQPGILVDGAHLFVKSNASADYQKADFPFIRERNMKTGMIFYDPRLHDPYEIAQNYDWIDTNFAFGSDGILMKKLNPNLKIYVYFHATGISDSRLVNYQDPNKYPITNRFAEALTYHPDWFYDRYDRSTIPPTDLENFTKLTDNREEYKKYFNAEDYASGDVSKQISYFFDPQYPTFYTVNALNASYQQSWKTDAIKYAKYTKADGLFVDTLYATGPGLSIRPPVFNTPDKIQKFMAAVFPDLRSQGIEIIHNQSYSHYETYVGKTVLNPFFNENDLNNDYNNTPRVSGLDDMLSIWYNNILPLSETFIDNSGNTVGDQFFQEWAFLSSTNIDGNIYRTNHWIDSLRDMDKIKEYNLLLPVNLQKTIFQNIIGKDKTDDPMMGISGWGQFAFGSYLLGKNEFVLFGIERRVEPDDPKLTATVPISDFNSISVKIGFPIADREIITDLYPDQTLQKRQYSNGMVIVNGHSTENRDYTLPNEMLDENDNLISGTITLPKHSARLLSNVYRIPDHSPTPIDTPTFTSTPTPINTTTIVPNPTSIPTPILTSSPEETITPNDLPTPSDIIDGPSEITYNYPSVTKKYSSPSPLSSPKNSPSPFTSTSPEINLSAPSAPLIQKTPSSKKAIILKWFLGFSLPIISGLIVFIIWRLAKNKKGEKV